MARFVSGLWANIKEKLQLQPIGYLDEVIATAVTIEEQQANRFRVQYQRRTVGDNQASSSKKGTSFLDKATTSATEGAKAKGFDDP